MLEDALNALYLDLLKLTMWETPTRGIEVSNRYNGFDDILASTDEAAPEPAPDEAIAADGKADTPEEEVAAAALNPPGMLAETILPPARRYSLGQYVLSISLIILAAILAYYKVLLPPEQQFYPWGSDTWGHLFKSEFLYQEVLKGDYYPQFTEFWYNGSQPFRYWAPLPYYALALLRTFTGNIFLAGNYFIVLTAILGGISWLFLARRMGLWPATMAGLVWTIWQDNVRVAFSEGNLPRVIATALLPLLLCTYLYVLEKKKPYGSIFITMLLMHLTVLTHAMIGAVYGLSLVMFTVFFWLCGGCRIKDMLRGGAVLTLGILSAGWWLLPSLTGGITQINPEAVKDYIQFVPASVSLNPLHRFSNRETFYWGISFLLALVFTLSTWRSRPPWARSLTVCGLVLALITIPVVRLFYTLLPLSNLLWPLRFSSVAALAVLAASFTFHPPDRRQPLFKSPYITGFAMAILFAFFFIDSFLSVRLLAYTGTKSFNLVQSAEVLKESPSWRVATIDLSQLGSAPSFLLSAEARREQVFGWAWQGAVTSSNIMLLNTGLEKQYYSFLMRSSIYLGATDLIVKDDVIKEPEAFAEAAQKAGYRRASSAGGVSLWHGLNQPYLIERKNQALAIGKFAGPIAMQFPGVEMGPSIYIDDYQLEQLRKYPMVIYTGASWHSKSSAEEIVRAYAASGGRVVVDLSGMPVSVLAKQPEFLGVYGEPVILRGQLEVSGRGKSSMLQPFSDQIKPWKAFVPMGLDESELEFSYYGNRAPIFGYKNIEGNKVWFIGGNITYHSFLTKDPVAISLVRDFFGLDTDYNLENVIPLTGYSASRNGYAMSYQLDQPTEAIVPVAAMDGIRVKVDGEVWPAGRHENLLLLGNLPAGDHQILISIARTPVHWWGIRLSIATVLLTAGWMILMKLIRGVAS